MHVYVLFGHDSECWGLLGVYEDESDARAACAACEAYDLTRPPPGDFSLGWDHPDLRAWMGRQEAWDKAHPGGSDGSIYRRFRVDQVPLIAARASSSQRERDGGRG